VTGRLLLHVRVVVLLLSDTSSCIGVLPVEATAALTFERVILPATIEWHASYKLGALLKRAAADFKMPAVCCCQVPTPTCVTTMAPPRCTWQWSCRMRTAWQVGPAVAYEATQLCIMRGIMPVAYEARQHA
jgi:hypothetical protein